jgi:hypothetical protein
VDDAKEIYEGKPAARALLDRYRVDWVCVGPPEHVQWKNLDERSIAKLALEPPLVYGDYRLYRVR